MIEAVLTVQRGAQGRCAACPIFFQMSGVMNDQDGCVEPRAQPHVNVVDELADVRVAVFVAISKVAGQRVNDD